MKITHRIPFILPSTRSFIREGKDLPGFSIFDLIHGYVYARWPYLYIRIAKGEHPLSFPLSQLSSLLNRLRLRFATGRTPESEDGNVPPTPRRQTSFADTYHGKVIPLQAATELVAVNVDVTLKNLEHVIPYALARDIILKNPAHIVVLECPCRSSKPNPCRPIDVCLVIGEPFAGFIREHHPNRSRRITQAEAIEILRAEDGRGHVHHAFFKDAMFGRFYAICNCCTCCCGAMQAHQRGTPMLASSGYVCRIDPSRCAACGTCSEYCQFGALSVQDNVNTVDREKCMGCGVCVTKCEHEALSLLTDPTRGTPLELQTLMAEAAQGS